MAKLNRAVLRRLANQRLVGTKFKTSQEMVSWHVAVQSQDYPGAKWAVGQRVKDCHDSDVHDAFNKGLILRTHVMRPTWHFVAPDDIGWLLELTAPRVHALCDYYNRQIGLDTKTLRRAQKLIEKELSGRNECTRAELGTVLSKSRIEASGQKLAQIMMFSELEGSICSGAMRGKQHTYALLEERAPSRKFDREKALIELTSRYFKSHGPATVKDLAWWSGLTVKDIRTGVEALEDELVTEDLYGTVFYSYPSKVPTLKGNEIHLLPNYDEYFVGFRDREMLQGKLKVVDKDIKEVLYRHIAFLDGEIIGGWKSILKKDSVEVEIEFLVPVNQTIKTEIKKTLKTYEKFLQIPVSLVNN